MIEGLRIAVTTAEIKAHLDAKVTYHERKRDAYDQQVAGLEKIHDVSLGASNDPLTSLMQSSITHGKKADYFRFLSEHLVPNEEYRLQEHELERLEWFQRYG